ncbi:DNA polymerase III subunit gamma/tau [Candidatus Peribacteria bacterium]|nr:DNA polymerase III subunit gamma/tau [Candidatus Peribacteria bacterium]
MALYLKYRPQTFADVVGQDHIVTTLEQSVERGRISHAYLFCGTRGTGKTSVARILAKTILLRGMEDATIRAQSTKGIEEGSFVDLIEIDAASNNGVDNIRDLIEKIQFTPVVSKAKVYIIDEVHMLSKGAFNALLKTLEEPPEYVYFILATTETHKVPDTIQSRCQRFLFKKVKDDDIIRRLQYIVDQERIVTDREALRAIARHALGSFRDGIALLDQLRSLEKIGLNDVTDRIGKTSTLFIDDIVAALLNRKPEQIKEVIAEIEESNVPIDLITSDLLALVRSHLHEAIAKKEDPSSYLHMTDVLLLAMKNIRLSPLPALVLESALIGFCMETEGEEKSHKKSTVYQSAKLKMPTTEVDAPANISTSVEFDSPPPKHALVEAEDLTIQNVLRHWQELLKEVTPASVRMSLKDGSVSKVTGEILELSFPSSFHRDRVSETHASRTIEDILLGIFKKPVRLKCILDKDSKPTFAGPATDLVEAAAEVFGNT